MSRFNLGASPQAPGIYRIRDQGRVNKDKTEAANPASASSPVFCRRSGRFPALPYPPAKL